MSVFERYLTVWVFLCIVIGMALGQWFPAVFQSIGHKTTCSTHSYLHSILLVL